jgi:Holliday junction resolvase
MGQTGADVQLSTAAKKVFPFAVECKSRASQQVYTDYEQAREHAQKEGTMPLVVLKKNRERPLVVVDAEWFITHYLRGSNENSGNP